MKYLVIFLLLLSTVAKGQQVITAKTLNVTENFKPPVDTLVNPLYLNEIRVRLQDSAIYIAATPTAARKWHKFTVNPSELTATDTLVITNGSAALDFPSIAAGGVQSLTIAAPGVGDGAPVALGVPAAAFTPGLVFTARVSSASIVTVTVFNSTGSAIDPPGATFKIKVIE